MDNYEAKINSDYDDSAKPTEMFSIIGTLVEKIENKVDWNYLALVSVWLYLCMTFFCILF